MTMSDNHTLTVDEAATVLKVSPRTVRNYLVRKRKPLPHAKPGGRVIITWADLSAWMKPKRF